MGQRPIVDLVLLSILWLSAAAQNDPPPPDLSGKELVVPFSLFLMERQTTVAMPTTTTMDPTTAGTTKPTTPSSMTTTTTEVTTAADNDTDIFEAQDDQELVTVVLDEPRVTALPNSDGRLSDESESRKKRELADDDIGVMADNTTIYPVDVTDEVYQFLMNQFQNHTGFKSLMILGPDGVYPAAYEDDPFMYQVAYNVETLSSAGLLDPNMDLSIISIFEETRDNITSSRVQFGMEELVVNSELTGVEMTKEIETVENDVLPNLCNSLEVGCSTSSSCRIESGEIMCTGNCDIFNAAFGGCEDPDTTLYTIYPKGECKLTMDGFPYCDCGGSDALKNYFIEPNCVNMAFVVGMAAGLGGGLILIFICALIGVSVCLRKEKEKSHDHISAYSDSPRYGTGNGTARPANNVYDNTAFVGYEPAKRDDDFDVMKSSLSHIDPHIDYSIRRPNLKSNSDRNGPTTFGPTQQTGYDYRLM